MAGDRALEANQNLLRAEVKASREHMNVIELRQKVIEEEARGLRNELEDLRKQMAAVLSSLEGQVTP